MDVLSGIPECIRSATIGYHWMQKKYGKSGATVYRLDASDPATGLNRPSLYLKFGLGRIAEEITAEADRLDWLAKYVPVPEVRLLFRSPLEAWLLTTAIKGENAYEALSSDPEGKAQIVGALAKFLRQFHSLSILECPFNNNHHLRLVDARRNLTANQVDELDFDPRHFGWSAQEVWEEMQSLLPLACESVVAHGDFSLGNIMLNDRKVTGCIDVGRVGTADRYQDLAILWNKLTEFGSDLQTIFLEEYGIEAVDQRRLQFHLCLDEFF